jgi:hypothetical protein
MNNQKLERAHNSREYSIFQKGYKVYCTICNRRAGRFDAYCGLLSNKKNRNWKQYREKQYKHTTMKHDKL